MTKDHPKGCGPQAGDRHSSGYDRLRDLPRLLRLWPDEVLKLRPEDQTRLIHRLSNMLRAERQRGIMRHWSYDLTRHAALLRALRAETHVLLVMHGRKQEGRNSLPALGPATALASTAYDGPARANEPIPKP